MSCPVKLGLSAGPALGKPVEPAGDGKALCEHVLGILPSNENKILIARGITV